MKPSRINLPILVAIVLTGVAAEAQSSLTSADAKKHIGERATVCGDVVSTHYAPRTHGNPTFINLDKPYPDQVFTLLIWGTDRSKFGDPEQAYRGKRVCVTGNISDYKGVPEIVAHEPAQIKVQ